MRHLSVQSKLEAVARNTTSASSAFVTNHRVSPWNSPVPYLFGGLAALLGLIAFALLILACSYLRLSSSGEEDGHNGGGGDEEKESQSGAKAANKAYEEKFIVIMAGEDMPRFLATPAMKKCTCGGNEGKMVSVAGEEEEVREVEEKVKDTGGETTTSQ